MERTFVEMSKQSNAMAAWDYVRECVSDTAIVDALIYCWGTDDMVTNAKCMVEEFGLCENAPSQVTWDKRPYGDSLWDYVRGYVDDSTIVDTLIYCWGTDDMFTYAAWMLEEFELDEED